MPRGGLTDYVPKQLQPDDLRAALLRAAGGSLEESVAPAARTPAEFDTEGLLAAFNGDLDDVREMLRLLAASVPGYVRELREAGHGGDAGRIAAAAHRLRGAVGNIGAAALAAMTREIEMTARSGGAVPASAYDAVERAAHDLLHSMSEWAEGLAANGPGAGRR